MELPVKMSKAFIIEEWEQTNPRFHA
jgi:hypothetical protein